MIAHYIAQVGPFEGWCVVIGTFAPILFALIWYAFRFLLYLNRGCIRMLWHDPKPMRWFTGFSLLTLGIGVAMLQAPNPFEETPQLIMVAMCIAPAWLAMLLTGGRSMRVMSHATFFEDPVVIQWPDSTFEVQR